MAKYKLLLDESGNFNSKNERYIIIGGVFFDEKNQEKLEQIFVPLHKHICTIYNCEELHASKNKEYYNYIAPLIGSVDCLYPVIFVIDKQKTFIFSKYDKISFKYNKAIEHLLDKMLEDKLLTEKDELRIKIDNINISLKEKDNLNNYLPKNYSFVKSVQQDDSRQNICLQLSDIIVNKFSKKTKCKPSDISIALLNPKIYCFLQKLWKIILNNTIIIFNFL